MNLTSIKVGGNSYLLWGIENYRDCSKLADKIAAKALEVDAVMEDPEKMNEIIKGLRWAYSLLKTFRVPSYVSCNSNSVRNDLKKINIGRDLEEDIVNIDDGMDTFSNNQV